MSTPNEDIEVPMEHDELQNIIDYVTKNDGFILPLSKICGVGCIAVIEYCKHRDAYELNIRAVFKQHFLFGAVVKKNDCPTRDGLYQAFEAMFKQLGDLRYSHIINRFIPKNSIVTDGKYDILNGRIKATASFATMFEKNEDIDLDVKECCVCLEKTINRLPRCDHNVCLQCETQLKKTVCPMCREKYHRGICDCDECQPQMNDGDDLEDVVEDLEEN